MSENNEEMIITLTDENGEEGDYRVLALFPIEDKAYIAVQPVELDDECYFYRYYHDEAGAPQLEDIEDDAEYDLVCEAFEEFIDEDEEE